MFTSYNSVLLVHFIYLTFFQSTQKFYLQFLGSTIHIQIWVFFFVVRQWIYHNRSCRYFRNISLHILASARLWETRIKPKKLRGIYFIFFMSFFNVFVLYPIILSLLLLNIFHTQPYIILWLSVTYNIFIIINITVIRKLTEFKNLIFWFQNSWVKTIVPAIGLAALTIVIITPKIFGILI